MNTRHNKASIMLMEIMINICFFAVLIAICMQLLVHAMKTSHNSTDLNHGVALTESVAEAIQAVKGDMDELQALYPEALEQVADGEQGNYDLLVFYDDSYALCSEEDAAYGCGIVLKEDLIPKAELNFYSMKDMESIYQVDVAIHEPYIVGEAE